jgi:hypothetical protein
VLSCQRNQKWLLRRCYLTWPSIAGVSRTITDKWWFYSWRVIRTMLVGLNLIIIDCVVWQDNNFLNQLNYFVKHFDMKPMWCDFMIILSYQIQTFFKYVSMLVATHGRILSKIISLMKSPVGHTIERFRYFWKFYYSLHVGIRWCFGQVLGQTLRI